MFQYAQSILIVLRLYCDKVHLWPFACTAFRKGFAARVAAWLYIWIGSINLGFPPCHSRNQFISYFSYLFKYTLIVFVSTEVIAFTGVTIKLKQEWRGMMNKTSITAVMINVGGSRESTSFCDIMGLVLLVANCKDALLGVCFCWVVQEGFSLTLEQNNIFKGRLMTKRSKNKMWRALEILIHLLSLQSNRRLLQICPLIN